MNVLFLVAREKPKSWLINMVKLAWAKLKLLTIRWMEIYYTPQHIELKAKCCSQSMSARMLKKSKAEKYRRPPSFDWLRAQVER